jgi:hypothetical protein
MDNKTIILLVVIAFIAWYMCSSKEHFTNEYTKQEDIVINPMVYDKTTGIVTSASEFVGLPDEIIPPWGPNDAEFGKAEILDDGMNGFMGLHYNMCSKSCCSQQYPPSFILEHDESVCESNDKFVGNTYKCNNAWQSSGCVCMSEKQRNFLANRGGNA